jgi:hypothetical protein
MRRLKFLLTALFGCVAVIFGEAFVRRVVAASLCGTIALNSSLCISSLPENKNANDAYSAKESHGSNTELLISEKRSLILSQKSNYNFSSDAERDAYNATVSGDLSRYDTISKRNTYYESIHNVLQSCPGTKGIQFFAAAENVTRFAGVGVVESIVSDHSAATKQLYKDINAELFKRNAEIVKSLLEKCSPVQPKHLEEPCFDANPATSNFDFDIAMTEFEQNLVQRQFIEAYQDNPAYKTVFEEIDNDLNFKGFKRTIGEYSLAWDLSKAANWAKDALGVSQLEYKSLNHRLALAQALIHIKHGKTQNDFKNDWKTQKYPDACSKKPKPACHGQSTGNSSGSCPAPNAEGKSYGDPHLITFDGFRYSFQTVGEFVATQSKDGEFKVQTRQAPVNRNLSMNSAVAMKVGRERVAFYTKDFPDQNTSNPLRVNGRAVTLENDKLDLPSGGSILKTGSNYAVSFPTGEKVFIALASAGGSTYFNVSPFVYKQVNLYEGLLGNANGNAKDELQLRGGQNISATQSTYGDVKQILGGIGLRVPGQLNVAERMYLDQVNKDFGNSWRVKPGESLFDYPSGKTTKDYTDTSFPEKYLKLDMLSKQQLEQARRECTAQNLDSAQMEGCIFDVGFTGFSEFAYSTAQINGYVDTVNQLFPGLGIPKIPRADAIVDQVIEKVKPKVCLPFVGCL